MAAFVAFPMPSVLPRHYWMFHSIWHVLLAAGESVLLVPSPSVSDVPLHTCLCNAGQSHCLQQKADVSASDASGAAQSRDVS